MNKQISRIIQVLLISLLTLGILFLGYFFYEHLFFQKPLTTALESSNFIEKHEIKDASQNVLGVKVKQVDSFAKNFEDWIEKNESILRSKDLALEIHSNPNSNLDEFYEDLNPAIYEALALGNFITLQEKFTSLSENSEVTEHKLAVTNDYLFLEIEDGEYYLYKVFRRDPEKHPVFINNIGSDKL